MDVSVPRGTLTAPVRRHQDRDLMSVSFEISAGSNRQTVCERDARRVQMARRLTAARLRSYFLDGLVDDAILVVSELVTNAIVHSGGTQVTFTMTVRDGYLHICVHDEMAGVPEPRAVDDDAEMGRGLFLVQCLARAHGGNWGIRDAGATTWCTLAVTGELR
ncbi:ATP-binding protein [Streptomyces sp. NPDC091376]|uniref:ATP-binding protein n=1 Tax=Streptomyces sp. NPDC091376 TaxID=3365994 RepID=UPI003828648A